MNDPKRCRARRLGMALLALWLPAAAGCGSMSAQPSPDRMLSLTVSGLKAADQIRFSGQSATLLAGGLKTAGMTFQGEMTGHKTLRLSTVSESDNKPLTVYAAGRQEKETPYNPVALLDRIEHADKTVRAGRLQFGSRNSSLIVELAPAAAKKELADRVQGDFNRTVGAARSWTGGAGRPEAAAVNTALDKALNAEIARSRAELDAMLRTLAVRTTYRLSVDRTRYLPRSLDVSTVYAYTAQGRKREERIDTAYRFDAFGGKAASRATGDKT